ncbi:MAG: HYR domain-containing protein, partial [Armatimonadetes bacterium]|nr:HYR domain-containing protein [Armatimonadota bacterium]
TTAPELTIPADPAAVEQLSADGTPVDIGTATATDICDADVAITNDAPEGGVYPLGATVVTWTATDDEGNLVSAEQTVTVVDTTGPSISVPEDITVEQATADGTAVSYEPTATDTCDAAPSVSSDPVSGTVLPLGGPYAVTVTATDASGNESTATFNVTVVDTTAATLTVTNNIAGGNANMSTPPIYVKAVTVSSVADICDAAPVVRLTWSNDGSKGYPSGTSVQLGDGTVIPAGTPTVIPVGSTVWVYTVSFTSNYRYILNFTATDASGNVASVQKVINLNKPSGGGGGGSATGTFKAGGS